MDMYQDMPQAPPFTWSGEGCSLVSRRGNETLPTSNVMCVYFPPTHKDPLKGPRGAWCVVWVLTCVFVGVAGGVQAMCRIVWGGCGRRPCPSSRCCRCPSSTPRASTCRHATATPIQIYINTHNHTHTQMQSQRGPRLDASRGQRGHVHYTYGLRPCVSGGGWMRLTPSVCVVCVVCRGGWVRGRTSWWPSGWRTSG